MTFRKLARDEKPVFCPRCFRWTALPKSVYGYNCPRCGQALRVGRGEAIAKMLRRE